MQSGRRFHSQEAVPPYKNETGGGYMHMPVPPSFASVLPPLAKHLTTVHDIEFQPSKVCPKNFVIFDQTDNRSQIMYHPALAHKFSGPGLNIRATCIQENFGNKDTDFVERETSSFLKEDSDDIDALLSLEEEEEEEYDEEEVSTGRTYGNYGGNSPDSCSSYGIKPGKHGSSSSKEKSSGCGSSGYNSERKRKKMKKMVKALRGIVPGGDEMNTVTVLDEAVRYLKSLKVEVQKLGVTNFKN